jgi:anti-sigma regulatory factor (Ser/Thr protein kinase)
MDSRIRALYKIDPRRDGPARARQIIAEELSSRLPAGILNDVKLMVSELVTNGIVHGSAAGGTPVLLDLLVNGDVHCRVLDHGPGFANRTRRRSPGGGWGLHVVEQLADRWGMQRSPQQTEVWFERHCP